MTRLGKQGGQGGRYLLQARPDPGRRENGGLARVQPKLDDAEGKQTGEGGNDVGERSSQGEQDAIGDRMLA